MNCEHSKMDNLPFHCQRHCVECGMSESEIKLSEKVKQLQAEVESLKNCMNCDKWNRFYNTCNVGNGIGVDENKCSRWKKEGD